MEATELRMFCAGCGADRTVPPSAADPGPCPACGSTIRTSCRPVLFNGGPGVVVRVTGHFDPRSAPPSPDAPARPAA